MTIPGESASMIEPMVYTTPPKVDKMDTSSADSPTTRALVDRPGSKAPNDNPRNEDPTLLNFTAVAFWITY
jgi:hypothetical protein